MTLGVVLQGAAPGGAGPGELPAQAADAAKNALDNVVGGVVDGLEQAAAVAGDTLRGIFGCLPWEQACDPSTVATLVDLGAVVA